MEMLQMTEPGRSSLVLDHPEGHQQQTQPAASATSFSSQANALMRKNATFQKRNWKTNACLIFVPLFICILLVVMQTSVNHLLNTSKFRCGCKCVYVNSSTCTEQCGLEYSTQDQAGACPVSSPTKYPAVLQVPRPEYRAVNDDMGFSDLPDKSCRSSNSCPVTFLYTGQNQSLAETITGNMLNSKASGNLSDALNLLSKYVSGTGTWTAKTNFLEPAFVSDAPLYILQSNCSSFTAGSLANLSNLYRISSIECLATEILWRNSSAIIDNETYHGYRKSNSKGYIDEISAAYDFQDTTLDKLNVIISYNATFRNDSFGSAPALVRASRSMNLVAQAFFRSLQGPDAQLPLWFVKEMPKQESRTRLDFTSLLGPLFFMWVIQLLFPVVLTSLVYEKQNNLRIMMKMHGLGDAPYWVITYGYFLVLSIVYMFCFVLFGSVVDLKIFRLNSYGIQLIFYLVTVNLQITFGFFVATLFSSVRTATVCGYLYVFGSGLLGRYLFQFFLEDKGTGRGWIFAMELIPAFSLYRGLYEFSQYAYIGYYQATAGMQWKNMNDHENGMRQILGIMLVESFLLLPLAYYLDQVTASGNGLKKHPLFFLKRRSTVPLLRLPSFRNQISEIDMHVEHADVAEERAIVEDLRRKNDASYAIVCDDLRKKYPGKDGNPDKLAVSGLSLAIKRGECFGMLGPNGAGKTTSINMMIGFLTPTSGTARIEGLDIAKELDKIYACMGVCPQHDLIWETLTGEEHLLFYGRLKNLNGAALKNAVETSLKSVNLYKKGVRDKQAGKYSGGMKRRLSVAISLIGNPKVVYMDEPSTGLDPASRNNLWNVIKQAKQERAIILTTHSMEEAEALCDRLGIFVNGQLQCIGNAKELRARYGGTYVLTITTPSSKEETVVDLVKSLSSKFKKVYGLSGTQKFEMPKSNLRIADVFRAVERNKEELMIQAWGLTDTTLEDVFIKVAVQSSAETSLP